MLRARDSFWLLVLLPLAAGCAGRHAPLTPVQRAVLEAARPILQLDPDADWTTAFNRLLQLGTSSLEVLAGLPQLRQPAAPDELRVMLCNSLIALLADPFQAPRLSGCCLTVTLDVLHFDIRVGGRPVGQVLLPPGPIPVRWPDLFPAELDRELAARVDVERDRQTLRAWLSAHRGGADAPLRPRPLTPEPDQLWHLLSRRYADVWIYELTDRPLRCAVPPERALLRFPTADYNLVRAACIWLGRSNRDDVLDRLIAEIGSPSPIRAHNARLALRYSPHPRIRQLIERYNDMPPADAPAVRLHAQHTQLRTPRGSALAAAGPRPPGQPRDAGECICALASLRARLPADRRGRSVVVGDLWQPADSAPFATGR